MNTVAGLRDVLVGARLRRLRDDAGPLDAAARPVARGHRAVPGRPAAGATHAPVVASPRQILRRQLDRLAERGLEAFAATELEFIVFRDTYEQAWHKGYRDLEPANLYNVDYSLLGTARVEPLIRRIRNSMAGAGPAGRELQGRVQPRPARDQLPLRARAAGGRRARDLQERRQGDRRPGGHGDHVHGQVRRARGQLVPHPPVAAPRRRERRCSPTSRRRSTASSPASSPACAS